MRKNETLKVIDSGNAKVTVIEARSRVGPFMFRLLGVLFVILGLLMLIFATFMGVPFIALGVLFITKVAKSAKTKIVSVESIDTPRYTGGPTFGTWNVAVHKGIPQMERFERGSRQDMVLLNYNDETGYGAVQSSDSFYGVSLDACSCPDFEKRSRPCKHIYFLATKMGYTGENFYQ